MFNISFRDVLMVYLLGFVFIIWAMLAFLNPPSNEQFAEPPGNLAVYIEWDEGDIDVDLWVTGPGEPTPVGYSNKSGVLWNLLRDDLGLRPDMTPSNFENAYTRGLIPGEYIINVHCYKCQGENLPVHVSVEVSVKRDDTSGMMIDGRKPKVIDILATTQLKMLYDKQEKTAIRFRLTEEGDIVPGSMNNVYRRIKGDDLDD
jgi:hypothetical protein